MKLTNIGLEKPDYKKLMSGLNPDINPEDEMYQKVVEEFNKQNRSIFFQKTNSGIENGENNIPIFTKLRNNVLSVCDDVVYVTDVLIHNLFIVRDAEKKNTFWEAFGDVVCVNLELNVAERYVFCEDCNDVIIKEKGKNPRYCDVCRIKNLRETGRLRVRRLRERRRKESEG